MRVYVRSTTSISHFSLPKEIVVATEPTGLSGGSTTLGDPSPQRRSGLQINGLGRKSTPRVGRCVAFSLAEDDDPFLRAILPRLLEKYATDLLVFHHPWGGRSVEGGTQLSTLCNPHGACFGFLHDIDWVLGGIVMSSRPDPVYRRRVLFSRAWMRVGWPSSSPHHTYPFRAIIPFLHSVAFSSLFTN